jgi:hypothetical protein
MTMAIDDDMKIVRPPHQLDGDYTEFVASIFDDRRLSFRALGVLTYLLSLPPDTVINSTTIARSGVEGRDSVRTALRDLEKAGYLRRGVGTSWVWNGDPSRWITTRA